jgi:alanine dehydrogenase
VKYLARKNSTVIGMLGAGVQAETQLMAIAQVLPDIQEVKVLDSYKGMAEQYATKMMKMLGLNIHAVAAVEDVAEADILVTTTPSREPIVKREYIKPGTHVNAIGADAEGKCELESGLLKASKIVVDNIEQASHSGEINVPLSQGLFKIEDIHATLGEIIIGTKEGRQNDGEITIFDSTGLAIQDIMCAKLVYESARQKSVIHG